MLRQLALRFMIAPKARGQAQALLSSTQELSLVKGEAKARTEEGNQVMQALPSRASNAASSAQCFRLVHFP